MSKMPYHEYQLIYDQLVTKHEDDLNGIETEISSEIVTNALEYFKVAKFPLVYPAKSYAVAAIYAKVLSAYYQIDRIDILNDKNLFLGKDPHFVVYDGAKEIYDGLLKALDDNPDMMFSGWAPKTVKYCMLECTEAGIERVMENADGMFW